MEEQKNVIIFDLTPTLTAKNHIDESHKKLFNDFANWLAGMNEDKKISHIESVMIKFWENCNKEYENKRKEIK
jgi:hypothetical protein